MMNSIASRMQDRLREIEGAIADLQAERRFLRKWIEEATATPAGDERDTGGETVEAGPPPKPKADNGQRPKRLKLQKGQGITGEILSLVENHPGISVGNVIDRIEAAAETSSSDPRRLISNTIYHLRKRKRLRRTGRRLYPVKPDDPT